jgi:hypothetical protein
MTADNFTYEWESVGVSHTQKEYWHKKIISHLTSVRYETPRSLFAFILENIAYISQTILE